MSSHSSHHPQEVLVAQFSLYVHEGGLKPHSFDLCDRVVAWSTSYGNFTGGERGSVI